MINARALGRSAAALISGYAHFDRDLTIAGVICNQIGSESHLERICLAVSQTVGVPILGGIPRTKPVKIPERHLGLWRANEDELAETGYLDSLAKLVKDHLDLEQLIKIAQPEPVQPASSTSLLDRSPSRPADSSMVRIGIARDQAFCFYYAANLSLLEQAGAQLVEFSPVQDALPDNLDGLYIGGGYPELYAEQLSENWEMCAAIANFCQSGRPVYAECGGLMYLSQGLLGAEKQRDPFVGILPFWTQMGKRVKLGYRQVEVVGAYRGFPHQGKIRGHRFHYSDIVDAQGNLLDITPTSFKPDQRHGLQFNYRLQGWNNHQAWEGYQLYNVLASYVHLHFGSNPAFAQQFVQLCRQ